MNNMQRLAILPMAKRIIVIFTILFFILFLSKIYNLRDYNIRQGIVVGFDSAEIIEHSRTLRSHTIYNVMRTTPIIEYYSQLDTIVYDEGKRTLLSYLNLDDSFFYTKGEKIKILELQENPDKVIPFTFFQYWLKTHELIILSLIAFVIYGYLKVFVKKPTA